MSDTTLLKRMFEQNFKLSEPIDTTLKAYEACYFNGTVWTRATSLIAPTGFLAVKLDSDTGNIALGSEVPIDSIANTALSAPVIANTTYYYDPATQLLNTAGTGYKVGIGYVGKNSDTRFGSILVNLNQSTPSVGGANVKSGYFTRSAAGLGPQIVTGIGFRPKSVRILAFFQSNTRISSDGVSNGAAGFTMQSSRNVTGDLGNFLETTSLVSVNDYYTATNKNKAILLSMDSDGFTLDWSNNDGIVNCIYTCIG